MADASPEHSEKMTGPTSLGGICCLALSAALGHQKVAAPGTSTYTTALESYFSVQQESLQPACIVLPQTVQDVSIAVKQLVQLNEEGQTCLFAVRSGGHTAWAGASNIQGGAVIDLSNLNTIMLSANRSSVSVGVGATWGDVYKMLDPLGLSVNGGRASTPGVGGLTLGSGVSYTSPRYGWTCDTVSQFEIILADGSVVLVDSASHPDLMWALKGGVNNFGIVTRVTLNTFQQGLVWSGTAYSLASYAPDVFSNFVSLNSATSYDEYASVITSFNYNQASGVPTVSSLLQYTKEVEETPATFASFMAVPSVYSATSLANMTDTVKVTAGLNPAGVRALTMVTTLVSNKEVITAAYEKWNTSYPALANVTNVIFSLILEPLPPAIYQRNAATNALGLGNRTEPLAIVEIFASWANATDDGLVNRTMVTLLQSINTVAQELGAWDPYLFANYANKDQDVIGSYGTASVNKLKQVRQQVDPTGVFTKLVPGGYKIPAE